MRGGMQHAGVHKAKLYLECSKHPSYVQLLRVWPCPQASFPGAPQHGLVIQKEWHKIHLLSHQAVTLITQQKNVDATSPKRERTGAVKPREEKVPEKEEARILRKVYCDRTKGNVFKLKGGRFWLDIRKKIFTGVVRHWHMLPRNTPSLEILKVRLDGAGDPVHCSGIGVGDI